MRRTLYVRMAIHAGKHAAMDGIFEALRIDVQADRLAVDVMSQRGIAMASQTLFRGRLRGLFAGGRLAGGEERSCG